ncbi:membrane protein [Streptomyces tuirus]|uniref:Membrane protein n=2 Tax=Streptomyces tuirus TaxID=68278 RepID=A0A7G1NDX4_9ACTN|nr:membrane protein [Streptomyces tuirus]
MNQQTRRGQGPARRIGRTLAFVLPVVLVLSGTLAVTRVNWSGNSTDPVLTAADTSVGSPRVAKRAPQEILRDKLLTELQEEDPGVALTHLQQAVNGRPSLAKHCASIARALGQAAVRVYGPTRAQSYARPVCDTAFATGVAAAHS